MKRPHQAIVLIEGGRMNIYKWDNVSLAYSRKALLVLAAIGFIIGTIIGASSQNVFAGMWLGIGSGTAFSSLLEFGAFAFKSGYEENGFVGALRGCIVWFVFCMFSGPIGFIIRFLRTW